MNIVIEKKDIKEVYETAIIQQTAFWSEVKAKQGLQSKAFNFKVEDGSIYTSALNNTYTHADFLVLLQPLDREHTVAYVPYGPEIEPNEEYQGKFLEELSESLRPHLPSKCILIRYDLAWQSHWAKDNNDFDQLGNWNGPPEKKYQEFRFNFNTVNWNLRKANSDILPSNTIFLDLQSDSTLLLDAMKPKTRYNINLSYRKGINVKKVGMENLQVWYALYQETALRNRIHINDITYFKTVLTARAENTASPADVELLLAELDGQPLAAMFLVISGNRGTYLYGASSSSNRNYMATYALQWEAMKIAKEKGCIEYDLFGVAPRPDPAHPLYGLYKFKSGFGGQLYHRMGCWDYPLNNKQYQRFIATEMHSQGYHI
ncbi:lipid II:glycine glycyltransferase (peptidoglycan interpeptide bridge formation enzyme) [Pedobacter sp. AK017]|uniref:lipid II:glycine glycyltransferase FemX n=1 Tax=Pedobacter sp. AK017 TaxID=2723073 RepID=UPI00160B3DA9|nr:peptidoglycan bridge formation glycyltransferase FemA/FemB family protein [Pedobacter sp. AK017]MBB5438402.1 lipid II:glycine glycyltransferase (peptidoglycan interpeptide bridge formation enzyme) [Pedobacter sp. AK017]